ncbi:hypothetical protein ITJ55_08925 [Frigoribacterium sp. VKM Ac-1396]|uniref:DUF6234 family protein n=1 Tax=Frigoribacterium sp. VKM Ac-1396 TaxID=2783821 RepID=UPI00188AE660|nr:DUF6234 family protein [Frigoribacterium sp. VKM Ac-1396]MBF4600933.1 hypothetical protein [Frigoribacterium sp. VKM Ac-1396]
MTNTQLRDRLAGAAASLRRRVDRREVAWMIGTAAALIVAGRLLFTVTASAGRVVASLTELPEALSRTELVPFVVWAVLAVLVAWRWSDATPARRAWLYVAAAAVARAGVELTVGSGVTQGIRAGISLYTLPTLVFVSLPFVATVGLAAFVVVAARSGRGSRGSRGTSAGETARPAGSTPDDAPVGPVPGESAPGASAPGASAPAGLAPATPAPAAPGASAPGASAPAAPAAPASPAPAPPAPAAPAPADRPPRHLVHRVAVIVEALALAAGVLLMLSLAGQWFSAEFSLFGSPVTVSDEAAAGWLRTLVACLACLVVSLFAAITAGHRGAVVATVVVAGLVVIGAVGAPVPGDRWESPTPRQEPLPANYTPCYSGSGKCN